MVISDHRYGFRSEKVPSIFVTHQVRLPVRWFEIAAQMLHKSLLKKYDCVWVLDFADHRLAGNLSKNNASFTVDYLGAVSRFEIYDKFEQEKKGTIVIVSGPSVYGQQFIDNLKVDVDPTNLYSVVAKNDVNVPLRFKQLKGNWLELDQEILKTKRIISRTGYSTIMDIYCLDCEGELTATPGQREQEYLELLRK